MVGFFAYLVTAAPAVFHVRSDHGRGDSNILRRALRVTWSPTLDLLNKAVLELFVNVISSLLHSYHLSSKGFGVNSLDELMSLLHLTPLAHLQYKFNGDWTVCSRLYLGV